MADVKCGLYEIHKNNGANATHRPSPAQNMFWDRTEAMLDRRDPEPGPLFWGSFIQLCHNLWSCPRITQVLCHLHWLSIQRWVVYKVALCTIRCVICGTFEFTAGKLHHCQHHAEIVSRL